MYQVVQRKRHMWKLWGKLESSGVETVMVLGLHLRRLGVEMMGF